MSKYQLLVTGRFKQDLKRCKKKGLPLDELWKVVEKLLQAERLEPRYRVHRLSNNRKGQWECHIRPDWLLVWEQNENALTLLLLNTGSHSELFDK